MANTTVSDAAKAHGASPPVKKRPPKKKRFRDGWRLHFRIGFLLLSVMGTLLKSKPPAGSVGVKHPRSTWEFGLCEPTSLFFRVFSATTGANSMSADFISKVRRPSVVGVSTRGADSCVGVCPRPDTDLLTDSTLRRFLKTLSRLFLIREGVVGVVIVFSWEGV